jgi:putative acetyltransferase
MLILKINNLMSNLTLREIIPSDNPSLAKVIRDTFIEHDAPQRGTVFSDPTTDDLYTLFRQEGSILWVAEYDNEIVGCCGVYPTPGLDDGTVELVKFYLASKTRGLGVGRSLLTQSIESAKHLGYNRMYLESLPHYAKAVSIYEKIGFTPLSSPMGESGHTSCNIWMVKDL